MVWSPFTLVHGANRVRLGVAGPGIRTDSVPEQLRDDVRVVGRQVPGGTPEALLTRGHAVFKRFLFNNTKLGNEVEKLQAILVILALLSAMQFNARNDRFALMMMLFMGLAAIKLQGERPS